MEERQPIIFPCAAKMYLSPTVVTILFSSGEGHHSPQFTVLSLLLMTVECHVNCQSSSFVVNDVTPVTCRANWLR